MYTFELTTVSPCRSAPYYSLVIRSRYILGHAAPADIPLAFDGISAEHVSLTVLRRSEAAREVAGAKRASAGEEGPENNGEDAEVANAPHTDLVVRVTALSTKGDAEVRLGDTTLSAGDSAIAEDGDVLHLGEGVHGTFHYRPLMVSIEGGGSYTEEYYNELCRMFTLLGATVVAEPIPSQDAPSTPIGQLYCATELNDSTSCLAALAYGYSVVQPTYVFEWFAGVTKSAAAPLNTLPAPSHFEVPVRCTTHPTSTTYLRPEPDSCPFSLFPIPPTGMTNRSRADLFAGRIFFFFTDAAATRYWRVVEDCGGVVYGPGDVEAAKEAIRVQLQAQRAAGMPADRLPNNFFTIVDNASEAVLLNSGLEAASPELQAFLEEAQIAFGATHTPVMGDHSLFTALLCNRFFEEPIPLTLPTAIMEAGVAADLQGKAFTVPPLTLHENDDDHHQASPSEEAVAAAIGSGGSVAAPRTPNVNEYGSRCPDTARTASRAHIRRASLLPRSTSRTPTRSQMRSFSRQQARATSAHDAGEGQRATLFNGEEVHAGGGGQHRHRGRRHLVPSVLAGELRSFAEDFDMLRIRIYAFLIREEPKLDLAITAYQKKFFLDGDTIEYALEVKAQAVDFVERVGDLMVDPACQGVYIDSLRRFARDCGDMDAKAQYLLHCWDRTLPAAVLPRRSHSYQGSRPGSRRTVSPGTAQGGLSRSRTPRSVARQTVLAPIPAAPADAGATTRSVEGSPEAAATRIAPGPRPQLNEIPSHNAGAAAVGRLRNGAPAAASSSSAAVTPRAHSTSTRHSARRSTAVSQSHVRSSSNSVPSVRRTAAVDRRPPWVGVLDKVKEMPPPPQAATRHREARRGNPARPLLQASAIAPVPYRSPRIRQPTTAGGVAIDSPTVVRARSAGRCPTPHVHHRLELGEGDSGEDREPVIASKPRQEEEPGAGEARRNHPSEAPSSNAPAMEPSSARGDGREKEEEEEESRMRTAPPPAPVPAPMKKTNNSTDRPESRVSTRAKQAKPSSISPEASTDSVSYHTEDGSAAMDGSGHRENGIAITGNGVRHA